MPSWTSAEDWESGFDTYTRQRRSDDDIRSVVADPDKRGAGYAREKKLAYPRERGYAARAEYVEPDVGAQALAPSAGGFPDARLERVRDRLVVVAPHGWVNLRSRPPTTGRTSCPPNDAAVAINANQRERIRLRNAGRAS